MTWGCIKPHSRSTSRSPEWRSLLVAKAFNVEKALDEDTHGDVMVDMEKSMKAYHDWVGKTRSVMETTSMVFDDLFGKTAFETYEEAYKLPENPFTRS